MRHAFSPTVFRVCMIAAMLLSFTKAEPAFAQNTPPCDQLEVVFVVDQSGSMRGAPIDHPVPNDPNGLRFYAPLHAVRWMGNDFVNANGLRLPSRPVITYHVALVDFGDAARVRLPWTTIAPADEQSWRNLEVQLSQTLAPFDFSLGNTNVLEAIRVARDLFDQRAPARNGCPRRMLMLLTDGMPYVPPPEGQTFSVLEHMRGIAEVVENDFRRQGVEFYITAINDSQDNYWVRMEPLWRRMLPPDDPDKEPRAVKVNTEDEIGQRFTSLLVELTERRVEEVRIGPRCVPPYLQQLVLTFYKRNPNEHLDVTDPVGPLTPSRTDVTVEVRGYDEPIETLIVQRPLPGRWEINTTAPRADVLIDEETLPSLAKLKRPSAVDALQYVVDELVLQLTDNQGNPLPTYTDPTFRLTVDAAVRAGALTFPVSFVDADQGEQKATFIPVVSGSHQLIVSARSSSPRQRVPQPASAPCQWETTAVLDQAVAGEFNVIPTSLVPMGQQMISATGGACPLQQGDQASVTYRWERSDNQQPVNISLPTEWEAMLEGPSSARSITVSGPDPTTGVFTATLPFDESGRHVLKVSASARLPDGTLAPALTDQRSFDVSPVQLVRVRTLVVLEPIAKPWWWRLLERLSWTPDDSARQIGRDPFWRLIPTDLEVLITTDGQTPVDPTAVLQSVFNGPPIQMTLANADGTNPRAVELVPTSAPGRYHATLIGLPLGRYEVRVAWVDSLVTECGFALEKSGSQLMLERIENPLIYVELLLLALVILAIALALLRYWCTHRNPCRGYLGVLDKEGKLIENWYKDLSGRNRWRLRRRDAPPARSGIAEIQVRGTQSSCGRDPYPDHKIWVEVVPITISKESQGQADRRERVLSPGETWKLDGLPSNIKYVLDQKDLKKSD